MRRWGLICYDVGFAISLFCSFLMWSLVFYVVMLCIRYLVNFCCSQFSELITEDKMLKKSEKLQVK